MIDDAYNSLYSWFPDPKDSTTMKWMPKELYKYDVLQVTYCPPFSAGHELGSTLLTALTSIGCRIDADQQYAGIGAAHTIDRPAIDSVQGSNYDGLAGFNRPRGTTMVPCCIHSTEYIYVCVCVCVCVCARVARLVLARVDISTILDVSNGVSDPRRKRVEFYQDPLS